MMQLVTPPRFVDNLAPKAKAAVVQLSLHYKGRSMSSPDPADLTSRMLAVRDARSRADFAALFDHFAPRLKGWLMRGGLNGAQSEDCVQETMVTLWHKSAQFDPARAGVSTWVFTIARNKKIDMLRKLRRPEPDDLPWMTQDGDMADDAADTLAVEQESEALKAALSELPKAQRELVEKAYFGELSHSEIATATGLPLGTIKSRIRLGLERLRHVMMSMPR